MGPCECCGTGRPAGASLRRRSARLDVSGAPARRSYVGEHSLCAPCLLWLSRVVGMARTGDHQRSSLVAVPSPGDRKLLFADQCHVCRVFLEDEGVLADLDRSSPGDAAWPPLLLCPACDAWIASLASDGRSAHGLARRGIDGPYGSWLFPNLRALTVRIDVLDHSARQAIARACETMEISVGAGSPAPATRIVQFVEAGAPFVIDPALSGPSATIALVGSGDYHHLRAALDAGATDWLTLPPTPQQVTAALTHILRHGSNPPLLDPATGLAMTFVPPSSQPALMVLPAAHQDRFELAWLLKRLCRGYDELSMLPSGQIVVVPRAPQSALEAVAARLQRVLHGRCSIEPVNLTGSPVGAPAQRLDVVG